MCCPQLYGSFHMQAENANPLQGFSLRFCVDMCIFDTVLPVASLFLMIEVYLVNA